MGRGTPGRGRWKWILALTVFMASAGLVAADQWLQQDHRIASGIHVGFVDVGGLTLTEAERKLQDAAVAALSVPLVVTDRQKTWRFKPSEIDLTIDSRSSAVAAYYLGREPQFFHRWLNRLDVWRQPRYLPVLVDVNRDKLSKSLADLASQTNRDARDASIQVLLKTRSVELTPAIEGRRLNLDKTMAQALPTAQPGFVFEIELVFDRKTPEIPDEHFAGIDTVLASYSTHFNPWDVDRNYNLRLAASRIHGKRLNPGEVFSYNQNVGRRTSQQGFRMAPVILDGKLVPDWGGGVCQVSSTLYNAALLSDLEIVDRSNHGRAIGYVPLGFDATVVDGQIDFKFRNNLKRPILIHSALGNDELTFAVLGDRRDIPPPIELDYVVLKVIEPVEVKQPDPTLETGKEQVDEAPQRGFRVASYRIRMIDGKQVSQLLATDDYDPVNRIVKVGTKPPAQGSTAAAPSKSPEKPGSVAAPPGHPAQQAQKPPASSGKPR